MKPGIGSLRGICCRGLAVLWLVLFGGTAVMKSAEKDPQVLNQTASPAPQQAGITQDADAGDGKVVVSSGSLELIIETKAGLNARSLRDAKTGAVFADGDYAWPGGGFPSLSGTPEILKQDDGSRSITFKGRLNALTVEQVFTAPANEPGVILEVITISNPSDLPLETADFKCGFTKRVRQGEAWTPDAADVRLCPVPYRRETSGKIQEFPLREVAEHGTAFAGWAEPPHQTPIWGAEGWVWSYRTPREPRTFSGAGFPLTPSLSPSGGEGARRAGEGVAPAPEAQRPVSGNSLSKGEDTTAFLLAKYNAASMEWSLMEPVKRGAETLIRFGGAGHWKHGHPEGSTRL